MPNVSSITDELPGDAKGHKIQSAAYLAFEDDAATPLISGAATNTATSAAALHLTVPANAMTVIFRATTTVGTPDHVLYGDNADLDGSASGKGAMKGDVASDIKMECIGETDIYIKPDAGTVKVHFMFAMAGKKP